MGFSLFSSTTVSLMDNQHLSMQQTRLEEPNLMIANQLS